MDVNKHILLVYRDSDARLVLKNILQKQGYQHISEASCGREAAKVLRTDVVDALITDIELGDLDGWRLGRLVRSNIFRCESSIPLIVVAETWCERIAETTAREFGINHVLPFEKVEDIPAVLEEALSQPLSTSEKARVLVIEDTEDTAVLARRILQRRFSVEIARDGQSGLDAWKKDRHDLVLLDVMLPKLSGAQVLKQIREVSESQPVVIMTAHGTMELAEELMLSGASDFISKPFEAEPLRRVCEIAARREDYLISNAQFASRVKSLHESKEAFRSVSQAHQHLLDNLSTVVFELDEQGCIKFLNQAWFRLTGFPIVESIGKSLCDFQDLGQVTEWDKYQLGLNALLSGESDSLELELRLVTSSGKFIWVECRLNVMMAATGERTVSGCLDDISRRKQAQHELEYMAMHDHLTGLFNRRYFNTALHQMAALSSRNGALNALLYIDLDHFKVINDTFGHYHGDVILRQIADLLLNRLRKSDVLCRIGGDEYAILLSDTTLDQAISIANELREIIQGLQCHINGQTLEVSCSIGISQINGSLVRPEEYLQQADIALYVAKGRGRNMVHLFNPDDNESEQLRKSVDWVRRVRKAISQDSMVLHFQPILHIENNTITHYEALVRLKHPKLGLVPPGKFIPALEHAGEMHMLDHWVIRNAIKMIRENPGLRRVAINLSAQAFGDARMVPIVEEALLEEGVDPWRIIFELTESASLSNISATRKMIERLHNLGCGFAVDDFGTGFSTFSYLKQLPADCIKVDGSFIQNLDSDPVNQSLVRAIHDVARTLGKKTLAEYVETEASLELVKSLGIDYAQGNYIGLPLPVESLSLEAASLEGNQSNREKEFWTKFA